MYVRDDRASGDSAPPAVWFQYSADRKGEHPVRHLKDFHGILQADAFAGYHPLYEGGGVVEAACWSHYLERCFILRPVRAAADLRRRDRRVLHIISERSMWEYI